jgi:hypothetical protein
MYIRKFLGLRKLGLIGSLAIAAQFLVTPAWASYTATISVNGVAITTATSNSTPANVTLPSDNSVDAADAVRVALSAIAPGATVSVVANNALIVGALSTNLTPIRANAGVATQSITSGVTTAEFYVYTTTTSLASFTISSGSTTNTYFLRGTAGPAYNIQAALPTTGYASTYGKLALKVTDPFGNAVSGVTPIVSAIGLTATAASATDATGTSEVSITYPTTAGAAAIQVSITATSVTGLAAPKSTLSSIITILNLEQLISDEKALRAAEKTSYEAEIAKLAKAAVDTKAITDKAAADAKALADKAVADAKALADKAVADAKALQTQAETALATLKTSTDAKIAEMNASITKLNTDITALKTSITTATTATAAVDKKYKALVAKYNTLAKRYKQPTIKP